MKLSTLLLILFVACVALMFAGNFMAFIPAMFLWIAYDNTRSSGNESVEL